MDETHTKADARVMISRKRIESDGTASEQNADDLYGMDARRDRNLERIHKIYYVN